MAINISHSISGAVYLSLKLAVIITILTIVYEIYEDSRLYTKTKELISKPLKMIGISSKASITMVTGVFLGIAYGSAILIKDSMENKMNNTDIILSTVFLSICHAIIEDTLIFVAVGANGVILLGIRIILALATVTILNRMLRNR